MKENMIFKISIDKCLTLARPRAPTHMLNRT